jgi:hypothetical protein
MFALDLSILCVHSGTNGIDQGQKKADVAEHPEVFNHVGLLVNGPSSYLDCPSSSRPTTLKLGFCRQMNFHLASYFNCTEAAG